MKQKNQDNLKNINPFSLVPVRGAHFCNRKEEIETLTGYAKSQTHSVIYGPRRAGKTSLVRQVIDALPKNIVPICCITIMQHRVFLAKFFCSPER